MLRQDEKLSHTSDTSCEASATITAVIRGFIVLCVLSEVWPCYRPSLRSFGAVQVVLDCMDVACICVPVGGPEPDCFTG
jgi:hypothetical protein